MTTAKALRYLWGKICNLGVEYKEKSDKEKEALGQEEREERER